MGTGVHRLVTRILLTDDDIAANRQGRLSERQRQTVREQRLVWVAGTAGLAGVAAATLGVLLLKLKWPAFASRGELFVAVPVALFWMWLLREMPRRWRQANRALREGNVTAVSGTVQPHVDFGIGLFRPVRYYVRVNGRVFRLPQSLQQAFTPGGTYRIYYTPHTDQFLGALLLTEESNSQPAPPEPAEPLTPREQEVLQLIAAGLSNRQIADQLSLSVNTVKMYSSQLYQKLGVNRRTEAVARARELHLL